MAAIASSSSGSCGRSCRKLQACSAQVRGVSEQVNSTVRVLDEGVRLAELHCKLRGSAPPTLLDPTRTLLHECDVKLAATTRRFIVAGGE